MVTTLVGISGSLRAASLNTALLRAAAELVPTGTSMSLASIADVPLYDGDIDVDGGPPAVAELKKRISEADGLVIATPEYNYGIPGVLKNAIDWVSRPAFTSVLAAKPVALLGAAPGGVGTARAQAQLRQVLYGTLSEVFPYREMAIGSSGQRFSDGTLVDEATRESIREMLDRYVGWINR